MQYPDANGPQGPLVARGVECATVIRFQPSIRRKVDTLG